MVGMDLAPQDVVAEVLRRLAPRSLAACRCVCKGWRAVVDANRLLRADLLPLTLDGIFYETCPYNEPMLFSSPATGRRVTGKLDYLDWPLDDVFPIMDCCSGLLLMCYHVVNPATRQWVRLPPLPPSCTAAGCTRCSSQNRYLVYDPALSPHYEVFLIPNIPFTLPTGHICMHICRDDESVSAMEWPPSPYIVHVFSSKTGCWKERSLLREGEAAGTVAEVKAVYDTVSFFLYAAYWKDALYVRCEEEFLLRINLLHDTYRVIKFPDGNKGYTVPRIGKSEKGVYCAFRVDRNTFQI
ncbi:F-box protein At5g07610-like [Triticum dicoccoides]|uniref:F-box protein At5g07610-like n=1 Tax=Triticum dicoccoides TaxID=85692 RepID=UPI001891D992|nr:F-box protein At5g07610-like [Triticum dicoccoides]XP_037443423.1 F-box protein At5g07610-like [Triticum dicoccoides]